VIGVISPSDFRGEEHERLEYEPAIWKHLR
jgi:hypothetical protein